MTDLVDALRATRHARARGVSVRHAAGCTCPAKDLPMTDPYDLDSDYEPTDQTAAAAIAEAKRIAREALPFALRFLASMPAPTKQPRSGEKRRAQR